MKAFPIKKINLDKSDKERQVRRNKLELQRSVIGGDEFSYVEICNPLKSGCIYEINNLNLKIKNNNKLKLSIGESILNRHVAKDLETNIIGELKEDTSMELLNIQMNKDEFISILDNYSIILLPGGSIFLKTMKPIDEIMIDMEWTEEQL